jgi:hypothetical protein
MGIERIDKSLQRAVKDAAWLAALRMQGLTLAANDIDVALPDPAADRAGPYGVVRRSCLTLARFTAQKPPA